MHKRKFGIYYWDTFDDVTLLIDEADTLEEARDKVGEKYGDRIRLSGADKVDIVSDDGTVVESYPVG
ncbi:hypothetical protein LCGC14_2684220 [marine sediment metagenome]|uniref:DUF5678 domain-containing protein n=1 Tax=marine sediment metagenome TaxID=412755 RepID=A0A0F9CC53_9ZZZZ